MFETVKQELKSFSSLFEVTGGILLVIIISVSVCIITSILEIPVHALGVDSSVLTGGQVHRLLTYPFIHCDVAHLLVSAGVLVAFASAVEKGHGTVRFLLVSILLSAVSGLLFSLLAIFLLEPSGSEAMGLVPVALSHLGMVTISSRLRKAFFFGLRIPTAALPWILLLVITLFLPGMVLLCNVVSIAVGVIYGKGLLSPVEMSESRATLLEKKTPFRFLKRIMGARFIPASAEEKRELLAARCKPPPGSYPVQAYAPAHYASPPIYGGWAHSPSSQVGPAFTPTTSMTPQGEEGHSHGGHGHSHGGHAHQGHGHSHEGHGHNHASRGHSHASPGHSHTGCGCDYAGQHQAVGLYGHYTGHPAYSQHVHGPGGYASASPAASAWLPPASNPMPLPFTPGQVTADVSQSQKAPPLPVQT